MKIDSTSLISFESKTPKLKTVSSDAQTKAKTLLKMMSSENVIKENADGTKYTADILLSISIDKAKFTDEKIFQTKTAKTLIKNPTYTFRLGKKNVLLIDTETGEILGYSLSFFKTLSGLLSQFEKTLNSMIYNFDNDSVVKKHFLPLAGYTKKGLKN